MRDSATPDRIAAPKRAEPDLDPADIGLDIPLEAACSGRPAEPARTVPRSGWAAAFNEARLTAPTCNLETN